MTTEKDGAKDTPQQQQPLEAINELVGETLSMWKQAGLEATIVSGGSTPTAFQSHYVTHQTEIRPGTSIYNDRHSVGVGSASFDECALHVHVTVVSLPEPDRGVIDAGSKVLTYDPLPPRYGQGHGHVLEYPEAVITSLSEEHAVVDFSACAERPRIGERLRVVPNHVCPVSNLVDEVVLHRSGVVEATVEVAARGKR